jgi:sulfite reductase (ferredoxin)
MSRNDGPRVPKLSEVERAKAASRGLRGSVAETLASGAPAFEHDDVQVLKFHGIYQQDDRDARRIRRLTGADKEHWFMVRCKIPGGELTADQYLALDRIAGRHGNASLRITTRQGFQLHGVLKDELKPAVAAINGALVSTLAACGDVERNVMAPPAPYAGGAFAEARRLAAEIAAELCPRSRAYHEIWLDGERVETGDPPPAGAEEPFYGDGYLPRKLKTAVALPEDDSVDVHAQDIGLIAIPERDRIRAVVLLAGGGLGMTHKKADTFARIGTPVGTVERRHAVAAVRAVAAIFRDHGNRSDRRHARLKYLLEEWGLDRFRRELESRIDFPLAPPVEMGPLRHRDHLGLHDQGDGGWFYGVFVAEGRIADTPCRRTRTALRRIVEVLRPRVLLTPDQNLLLADLDVEGGEAVEQILGSYGVPLPAELSLVRRHGVACPALPTCGLALAEAERAMEDVIACLEAELSRHGLDAEEIAVRMTGCPNGCARPYTADVGIVGRSPGVYDLYVGGGLARGRLADLWDVQVPIDRIAESLSPLLAEWAGGRRGGEGLGDYFQRVHRGGSSRTLLTGDKSAPAARELAATVA